MSDSLLSYLTCGLFHPGDGFNEEDAPYERVDLRPVGAATASPEMDRPTKAGGAARAATNGGAAAVGTKVRVEKNGRDVVVSVSPIRVDDRSPSRHDEPAPRGRTRTRRTKR